MAKTSLGSIVPVSSINGITEYRLLNKDLTLLQNSVKNCHTGSTAYVVDTGALYMFHAETATWYEQ